MKLHFDRTTNTTRDPDGITSRVVGFDSCDAIEYIDGSWAAYLLGNVGMYSASLISGW